MRPPRLDMLVDVPLELDPPLGNVALLVLAQASGEGQNPCFRPRLEPRDVGAGKAEQRRDDEHGQREGKPGDELDLAVGNPLVDELVGEVGYEGARPVRGLHVEPPVHQRPVRLVLRRIGGEDAAPRPPPRRIGGQRRLAGHQRVLAGLGVREPFRMPQDVLHLLVAHEDELARRCSPHWRCLPQRVVRRIPVLLYRRVHQVDLVDCHHAFTIETGMALWTAMPVTGSHPSLADTSRFVGAAAQPWAIDTTPGRTSGAAATWATMVACDDVMATRSSSPHPMPAMSSGCR